MACPFASPDALFNLSKLSVWGLRLVIAIERIKPGHPQQNGRHKRLRPSAPELNSIVVSGNSGFTRMPIMVAAAPFRAGGG